MRVNGDDGLVNAREKRPQVLYIFQVAPVHIPCTLYPTGRRIRPSSPVIHSLKSKTLPIAVIFQKKATSPRCQLTYLDVVYFDDRASETSCELAHQTSLSHAVVVSTFQPHGHITSTYAAFLRRDINGERRRTKEIASLSLLVPKEPRNLL